MAMAGLPCNPDDLGVEALLELIERGRPSWHAHNACKDCDPAVDFFPGHGESLAPQCVAADKTQLGSGDSPCRLSTLDTSTSPCSGAAE